MLSKIFTTVALAASLVSAQTFSECDPTKKGGSPSVSCQRAPNVRC